MPDREQLALPILLHEGSTLVVVGHALRRLGEDG
jgi:hypothetical protein